jgi:hypothetical protein
MRRGSVSLSSRNDDLYSTVAGVRQVASRRPSPSSVPMAERVLVKTVSDTPIYVDPSTGRFEAALGRQKITRRSLADLEREVFSRPAGRVELMNLRASNQWSSWEQWPLPTRVVVVRVEREHVGRPDEQTRFRLVDGTYASGSHFPPWTRRSAIDWKH